MKKVITIFVICFLSLFTLGALNTFSIPYKDIIFTVISVGILLAGCFLLKTETKDYKNTQRFLRTMPLRFSDVLLAVVSSVIIISGSFVLNYLEGLFWNLFNIKLSPSGVYGMETENHLILLCIVVIVPAIFEELFFRGAVLSALSKKMSFQAMLWSAIFFTLMHGSVFNIPSTLFSGFVLAAASYLSGTVFTAMIAHLLNNVLTFILCIYSERISFAGIELKLIALMIPLLLLNVYFFLGLVGKKIRKDLKKQGKLYNEGEKIWNLKKFGSKEEK